MWSSRRIWVQVALHRAILRSDQMPASGGFNRNATRPRHRVAAVHPRERPSALMLAAGSLRELRRCTGWANGASRFCGDPKTPNRFRAVALLSDL